MPSQPEPSIPGRGTPLNPRNRFVSLTVVPDDEQRVEDDPSPRTQFMRDASRSLISENDSPDIPFRYSINPYRGCEHGCIYCYARPTHEWLGFSSGLDFETKILVKQDAPELLRAELLHPRWQPASIAIGAVTDPYQPVERRLRLTRRCLEVFRELRHPATVITKNHAVAADVDILAAMARDNLVAAFISITTLDADLARVMEPRTATPRRRLDAIRTLADAGVPVGVMVAPIIPGLTDHEMPDILKAASDAGAITAGYVPLRLPFAVKDLFESWLARHFPDRKDKVLNRVRSMRGGKLNDPSFGGRMSGQGPFADHIRDMFHLARKRAGLTAHIELDTGKFRRPGEQLRLF